MIPVLVVLYNPTSAILQRLEKLDLEINLWIFDNSTCKKLDFNFKNYYKSKKNEGISGAILWAGQICTSQKLKGFIFFDQDTFFTKETIFDAEKNILSYDAVTNLCSHCKSGIALRFVINSGTYYPAKLILSCKSKLKNYFVDAVDLFLSCEARYKGYQIKSIVPVDFDHVSQQGYSQFIMFGKKINFKVYSYKRCLEFYSGHFRLLYQEGLRVNLYNVFYILKMIISFSWTHFLFISFKVIRIKYIGKI
jgi:hypothetical protein